MIYRLANEFHRDDSTAEELDTWATSLFDLVADSDNIANPDLEATLAQGDVTITFDIEADDIDQAMEHGAMVLRACLRIVEGENSAWQHKTRKGDSRRISASPISC